MFVLDCARIVCVAILRSYKDSRFAGTPQSLSFITPEGFAAQMMEFEQNPIQT